MAATSLVLGPVQLQDFEIPCGINFGGTQRLAVHQLPGGVRLIDTLGRDDANICFAGIFTGDDATWRARLVDEMRASGALLPLTWDVFFYTVVIAQFQADYTTDNWIPYKLTCTVLRDEASALIDTALALGATVIADIGSAVEQAASGGVDLSSAQSAFADPSAMVRGTASYGAAQAGLASAQSSLATALGGVGSTLPSATVTSAGDATAGITGLASAVGAAMQISQLAVAQSFVGRAAVNLANAGT